MIVPAGRKHGFRNTGTGTLHVQATLAAPMFEAAFDEKSEVCAAGPAVWAGEPRLMSAHWLEAEEVT